MARRYTSSGGRYAPKAGSQRARDFNMGIFKAGQLARNFRPALNDREKGGLNRRHFAYTIKAARRSARAGGIEGKLWLSGYGGGGGWNESKHPRNYRGQFT